MKLSAIVMMMKLLNKEKDEQIFFIKKHLHHKEFMELIYLGYHTGIAFNFTLDEVKPRPQVSVNSHKLFFKCAMDSARNPFDLSKKEKLKEVIKKTCPLSQYIYAKIINKSLGLSRNDLEKHIPGLIEKEPYESISDYGSPKFPCILQTYDDGVEAVVSIGDTSIVRDINLLKDKSGTPISGFEKHVEAIKKLGLKGTFNVIINSINEEIFLDHSVGIVVQDAWDIPMIIIDYQINASLSERLLVVEAAWIENPSPLVFVANSVVAKSINDIYKMEVGSKVVARQDELPILREKGNHSIDVTYLTK